MIDPPYMAICGHLILENEIFNLNFYALHIYFCSFQKPRQTSGSKNHATDSAHQYNILLILLEGLMLRNENHQTVNKLKQDTF